jgi:hypothetical protein
MPEESEGAREEAMMIHTRPKRPTPPEPQCDPCEGCGDCPAGEPWDQAEAEDTAAADYLEACEAEAERRRGG